MEFFTVILQSYFVSKLLDTAGNKIVISFTLFNIKLLAKVLLLENVSEHKT